MTLGSYVKSENDRDLSLAFANHVQETTWPWLPLETRTYTHYDIDEDCHRVIVEIFFSDRKQWMYWFQMDISHGVDKETLFWTLQESLRIHFRNCRIAEPEPNIILGEN